MQLTRDQEFGFLKGCLEAYGVRSDVADAAAEQMTEADLRGYGSHGLLRLPMLTFGVREGIANPDPHPRIVREQPTGALIDGDKGLGGYVGRYAIRLAIEKARAVGVGIVVARGGHYSGLLAYFAHMAAADGFVAIISSTTPPMVHAWGGRTPVIGTAPLCFAVPGEPHPYMLDMATSEVARGKIIAAHRQGKPIPEGWAIDEDGNPTTDAERAMAGALSPSGGHKGFGLAFILSLLTGPMAGVRPMTNFDSGTFRAGDYPRGDLFLVFDPGMFGPLDEFIGLGGEFADAIRQSPRAPGFDEIRVPGDGAYRTREQRLRDGIPIADGVWADAVRVAEEVGFKDIPSG